MAILSWGKPKLEICELVNGAMPDTPSWVELDTPVENSTQREDTEGEDIEAREEGGALVDKIAKKNTYVLSFELFSKKNVAKPIQDTDGVILTEYAIRLTPEDPTARGFILNRCCVKVVETWTSQDGEKWRYTFSSLVPTDGGAQKEEWFAEGLSVSPTALYFGSAADSTGKTVTASSEGNLTQVSSTEAWATVTKSGKVATVKVTQNSTGSVRTAVVTLVADGMSRNVPVTQIPA